MTREEAKYAVEVMQAYIDGKDIEFLQYGNSSWETVSAEKGETVTFDWDNFDYRIKKESTHRPFKSKEECWNEMQKHHPFGWTKDKDSQCYENIAVVAHHGLLYSQGGLLNTYEELLDSVTFADGTPFGIKEES